MHAALTVVLVLFGAALVAGWAMRALRAPAILGFLLAGIAVGPSGLNLIGHGAPETNLHFFAELGLVFLLFTVGLELSTTSLLRAGLRLLVAAALQIVLTAVVAGGGLLWLTPFSWPTAAILGLAVALSSTAIVLKHLSDRGETETPAGGLITGVLLLQDIAVILVLILLPLLSLAASRGAHWSVYALKIGGALAGLVAVTLVARLVVPRLVNLVFRFGGREMMTLFAIVIACLGAWLASLANWSWPLGAFIAGLLLAQTDVRHQLHAEIMPFRDTFNALFFVSVGMLVDLGVATQHAVPLLIVVVATLVLKAVLMGGAALVAGWPLRLALTAGIGLCTVSEFGYVLVSEATRLELIPASYLPLIVAWIVGTMLLGALLVPVAGPIGAALSRWLQPAGLAEAAQASGKAGAADRPRRASHVIVVGYGVNGQNVATVLKATRIPFAVVEMNRSLAQRARQDGADVVVGDAARAAILQEVGLEAARALVVAISEVDATRRIVAQTHTSRPDLYILARTRYVSELDKLHGLGARDVIPEEFETSIEIFAHVLKEFGVPDNVIHQQVTLTRVGHYGMLRGRAGDRHRHTEWLRLLELAVTQTYLIEQTSPAAGQTIRAVDLRARTGVTIVAVTRAGQPTPNPSPDFRLAAGDVLVLVGTHRQLDEARRALEPATPPAE